MYGSSLPSVPVIVSEQLLSLGSSGYNDKNGLDSDALFYLLTLALVISVFGCACACAFTNNNSLNGPICNPPPPWQPIFRGSDM